MRYKPNELIEMRIIRNKSIGSELSRQWEARLALSNAVVTRS
jgi:hypothetical protein